MWPQRQRPVFDLVDGELRNRASPTTFHLPTKDQRRTLEAGAIVKLIFHIEPRTARSAIERMWVIVTAAGPEQEGAPRHYIGVLDSAPATTDRLQAGEVVRFEDRHVIDIFPLR